MKGAVLVVDDDPELTRTVSQFLRKDDFAVTEAASARDALKELERRPYDFVVTDVKMPGMNGLEFCERVTSDYPDVPVFIVTALSTLPTAVEAIRVGAYDFITKPLNRDELLGALNRAAKKRQIQEYTREAPPETEDVQRSGPLKEIVGDSLMIETARRLVSQVGPLSSTILLQGEEGTGKALVARVAHDLSPRDANGRFIIVRCKNRDAAGLIEELFAPSTGTAKGRSKPRGAFARADGGTLYLAGVDSLPGEVQAQLVAYLDGERAAENEDHYPDVRLICSSEQKLEAIVEAGTFRSDLYLRISSITMTLPPLRDRGADILLIADRYLREISRRIGKRVSGLTQAATERLMMYTWPRNVAELVSVMERAVAVARFEYIRVEDLPDQVKAYRNIPLYQTPEPSNVLIPLDQLEQRHILNVLKQLGGNKTLAARALGLDRKTLYRKLEQYGYDEKQ